MLGGSSVATKYINPLRLPFCTHYLYLSPCPKSETLTRYSHVFAPILRDFRTRILHVLPLKKCHRELPMSRTKTEFATTNVTSFAPLGSYITTTASPQYPNLPSNNSILISGIDRRGNVACPKKCHSTISCFEDCLVAAFDVEKTVLEKLMETGCWLQIELRSIACLENMLRELHFAVSLVSKTHWRSQGWLEVFLVDLHMRRKQV